MYLGTIFSIEALQAKQCFGSGTIFSIEALQANSALDQGPKFSIEGLQADSSCLRTRPFNSELRTKCLERRPTVFLQPKGEPLLELSIACPVS